jgi:hypothetical protein
VKPTVPPSSTKNPESLPNSWLEDLWDLPIVHFFTSMFQSIPEPAPLVSAVPISTCTVSPLDAIDDPDAARLEASVGSDTVVDLGGLTPAAADALGRFQSNVAAAGGTMVLKSAFRPAAYQQHLQNVWYKWMAELRNNADPGCQTLRAEVSDEFTRHHLMESQHPVTMSDHTRGLAFDATVDLPAHARFRRTRATLDRLAKFAGLLRPAIAADPVHFKYVGLVSVRAASVRAAGRRRNG